MGIKKGKRAREYNYPGLLRWGLCILFIFALICCCGCINDNELKKTDTKTTPDNTITITDRLNNTVSFPQPVSRIITTSTYATEYLITLDAENAILGVNSNIRENPLFSDYLKKTLEIGISGNPDIEKIISLHPDVVILPVETSDTIKAKLNSTGIKAVYFDFYSLEALPDTVLAIGKMTGHVDRAERYLQFYRTYEKILTERLENVSTQGSCRVYYEMSGDYSTSGKGSGGYNYLKKLKANNIAGNLNVSYPIVSPEWIISENPEVIIKLCDQTKQNNPLSRQYEELIQRPEFTHISAGTKNRVYIVSTNVLYGPRVIIGLLSLSKVFYPERFADIDPEKVLQEFSKMFFQGADKTEVIYPDHNLLT